MTAALGTAGGEAPPPAQLQHVGPGRPPRRERGSLKTPQRRRGPPSSKKVAALGAGRPGKEGGGAVYIPERRGSDEKPADAGVLVGLESGGWGESCERQSWRWGGGVGKGPGDRGAWAARTEPGTPGREFGFGAESNGRPRGSDEGSGCPVQGPSGSLCRTDRKAAGQSESRGHAGDSGGGQPGERPCAWKEAWQRGQRTERPEAPRGGV